MEKLEWGTKLIFLMLFVFSWPKCCGVRIERKASGDVFEKGYYSLRDDRLKVDCSVGGEYGYGTGSASPVSFTNSTHCRCGSGQTFCFDDAINEPKCMVKYGQDDDDLGCGFHLQGSTHIKALSPQSTSQSIGSLSYIYYHRTYNNLRSMKLTTSSYWNMTWQPVQLFIVYNNGNLKWISYNDTIAREYRGLLFKLDLQGQYERRRNRWRTVRSSCLLLKMTGTRSYPLPAPVRRLSTSSAIVQSSASSQTLKTSFISPSTSPIQSSSTITSHATTSTKLPTQPPERRTSVLTSLKTSSHPDSTSSFIETKKLGITTQLNDRKLSSSIAKSKTLLIASTTAYELHSVKDSRHLQTAKPTESKSTISIILQSSKVNDNQGGSSHERKTKDSQAGLIAGVTVAVFLFAVAIIVVFILCQRRNLSKGSSNNRKETLTLNLTDNTVNNEIYANNFKGELQGKDQFGNPLYADQIRLKPRKTNEKSSMNNDDYACNEKAQNDLLAEPIYKEVEDEAPIYQEADAVYQSINKEDISSPDTYQPIDATTLPRRKPADTTDPVQSPIYQVLEESNAGEHGDPVHSPIYNVLDEEPNTGESIDPAESPIYQVLEDEPNNGFVEDSPQSPIYQVVNPEVYEDLNQNGRKPFDDVYTGLDATTMNRPKQEPFYQELQREYGEINSKFDHDEEEV